MLCVTATYNKIIARIVLIVNEKGVRNEPRNSEAGKGEHDPVLGNRATDRRMRNDHNKMDANGTHRGTAQQDDGRHGKHPEREGKRMNVPMVLSIRETAKQAGVPVAAVRRWVRDKRVRVVTSGNRYYVSWASVVKFLEEGEEQEG